MSKILKEIDEKISERNKNIIEENVDNLINTLSPDGKEFIINLGNTILDENMTDEEKEYKIDEIKRNSHNKLSRSDHQILNRLINNMN